MNEQTEKKNTAAEESASPHSTAGEKITKLKKVIEEKVLGEESKEEFEPKELDELELLQEVYRNTSTGMHSVEVIRPLLKDKALKNILFRQYNGYKALSKEVELYAAERDFDVKPSTIFAKAVMYGSVIVNTITDRSTSKLAEIMIQGINMGIISLVKVMNSLDAETSIDLTLANKLMDMLQSNLETLKSYL